MKIVQFEPNIGLEEYESIKDCFKTKWLTEGPKSQLFVEELNKLIKSKYGVLAPNGTLSLFLGLLSLGIKPGDEVIVPNFTFIASATSICLCGAEPIFVDIEKDTLQIDVDACEKVITEKTKAIMPVHIFGMSANMDKVMAFAKKHNIKVIEDAAQAIGVYWGDKHCGTFGDVGSFSFFADKTITTAEGGFVCTNDEETYENLCFLRNQGRKNRGTFVHPHIGFNFRMNDILSSIGLTQLKKLDKIINKKKNILKLYENLLKDVKQVKIIKPDSNSLSSHVPFRVCLMIEDEQQDLSDFMKDKKIESRTFFYPLHKQPCFSEFVKKRGYRDEDFKNSIDAFHRGVCLPSYPELTEEEIEYVCNAIKEYYNV